MPRNRSPRPTSQPPMPPLGPPDIIVPRDFGPNRGSFVPDERPGMPSDQRFAPAAGELAIGHVFIAEI